MGKIEVTVEEQVRLDECTKFIRENVTGKFKPCAYYQPELGLVIVMRKDCSYIAQWLNTWSEMFWDNYRPWYAPWEKSIGFSVYCPLVLGLIGDMSVKAVLDRVLEKDPSALGKQKWRFYWLARGLTVHIFKAEPR
jgi:hypothetical protein